MRSPRLAILAALALAAPAMAQPTAFTYQGRLTSGGQPASGAHDLQFRLFDAPTGGSQAGPTLCLDDALVTEGLFTATLDFGQQYDSFAPRFLEVQVRADTGFDCSNASGLVVLSPRQRLTPAPAASHARAAFVLDAPNGSRPGALFVDNAGRVGVGTLVPLATLHVRTPDEGLRVQGSSFGDANLAWLAFADAAGTQTGYLGDASGADSDVYLASESGDVCLAPAAVQTLTVKAGGNVGIGTSAPAARLDVRGDIRLGSSGQFRAAAGEENLRIVEGEVNASIFTGTGFTMTQTEPGKYRIFFNPPFAALPAITATVVDGPVTTEALPFLEFPSASSVLLEVYERSTGDFVDRTVHFMAVGPR